MYAVSPESSPRRSFRFSFHVATVVFSTIEPETSTRLGYTESRQLASGEVDAKTKEEEASSSTRARGDHDFVGYDDDTYVTQNVHVQRGWSLESVRWAFTTITHYYWHPLTWLSHMTDVQLFGMNAGVHHLVSL